MQSRLILRVTTFAVWSLAVGSATYIALRLAAAPDLSAAPPAAVAPLAIDPVGVSRVLGAADASGPSRAAAASRFVLIGIVAGFPDGSAALIAVDGRPAQPFRVGNALADGLVLKSASGRRAVLAASLDGPAVMTLDMPPLPK